MSWWKKVISFITPPSRSGEIVTSPVEETEIVRARNAKGRFVADDPSTPDVNEAYTTRKKRTRKSKKAK